MKRCFLTHSGSCPRWHNRSVAIHSGTVTKPRSNRLPISILFAVLWAGGMVLRAPAIDVRTVITAIIAGAIVGGLMYWLFDKFRPHP